MGRGPSLAPAGGRRRGIPPPEEPLRLVEVRLAGPRRGQRAPDLAQLRLYAGLVFRPLADVNLRPGRGALALGGAERKKSLGPDQLARPKVLYQFADPE